MLGRSAVLLIDHRPSRLVADKLIAFCPHTNGYQLAPCPWRLTDRRRAAGPSAVMELLAASLAAPSRTRRWNTSRAPLPCSAFLVRTRTTAGRVYRVAFEPGAGTNWHTHGDVQILYVVEGRCVIQTWGGAPEVAEAGDVVRFEPGEKHWHGATADGADDPHRDQPRRIDRVAGAGRIGAGLNAGCATHPPRPRLATQAAAGCSRMNHRRSPKCSRQTPVAGCRTCCLAASR